MTFAPRTAIVTGSDSGIGRATTAGGTSSPPISTARSSASSERPAGWSAPETVGGSSPSRASTNHQPRVGSSAYDAAKHGLGGLMKTIAQELGEFGITANRPART